MISSEVLDRIKRRLGAWEANDPTAIAKDFGPGGVMPRQDLVALVGRRTQAWNDHDPDAVSACYAANGVWRDLRRDAPARGRGAIPCTSLPSRTFSGTSCERYVRAASSVRSGARPALTSATSTDWHRLGRRSRDPDATSR